MQRERIEDLIRVYRDGLLDDTMPFWIDHGVDREHGGFLISLDRDGSVLDTDKAVWQQARFTWLLGELYNNVEADEARRERWLELAEHGAAFLARCCFDVADGRMWFLLTRDGQPLRKRRYAFTESFAAIAFGELAQATGEDRYAELAERTFRRFIEHSLRPAGVDPKFTATRPTRGLGFPMIAIVTAQELRDSIGLTDADNWIDRSIAEIRDLHVRDDMQCVLETVGPAGEFLDTFDGRMLNPGHAIEAAWFIMREGERRADDALVALGCKILDSSWERGWDAAGGGGLLYFVDVRGRPVQEYWHDMKFWWPHNEAVIATLLAYSLTGDPEYSERHARVHDWSYSKFPDAEHGEWFGYLHRDGSVSSTLKGSYWKGPFHMPRMQLICWKILTAMQARGSDS